MDRVSPYCIERYGVGCGTFGSEAIAIHNAVGWSA